MRNRMRWPRLAAYVHGAEVLLPFRRNASYLTSDRSAFALPPPIPAMPPIPARVGLGISADMPGMALLLAAGVPLGIASVDPIVPPIVPMPSAAPISILPGL